MPKATNQSLARILRETAKFELKQICLVEMHCKRGTLRQGELPSEGTQGIQFKIQIDSQGRVANVFADYNLVVAYQDRKEIEQPLHISAQYGLQYTWTAARTNKNDLRKIVQRVAMLNSWPYWRELVQSTTVRMGLPAFPVPLINAARLGRISDAPKYPSK